MIRRWLADSTLDWFLAEHYQREPLVRPGTAAEAVSLLTWRTIERLVSARPT